MKKIIFFLILTSVIIKSIGQTWSTVGSGINNNLGRIESMCEYNGVLYVGGYFDNIGGLQVNSLAKWNGTAWDSVPGMTAFGDIEIFDMIVYNNELIISGSQIKKWDGNSWSNIGSGIDNYVFALEVYNNELYATGDFENAGSIPSRGIAKWNGIIWDSVGGPGLNLSSGFSGSSLRNYNGMLYLAGSFNLINGLPVHNIARWNGIVWDSVGTIGNYSGFQNLCAYNNKLYAGGLVNIINNPNINWIGSWNDLVWDTVGGGLNSMPKSLATYNNELYAAGDFDTSGSSQTLGIARWNDSQWNSVGSGLDLFHSNIDTIINSGDTFYLPLEHIYVLYSYKNELYVGGKFSMIGGISANCIAKWHVDGASINEQNNTEYATIFPNPFTVSTKLQLLKPLQSATLSIYDILGKEVKRIENINGTEIIITREGLKSGLYFFSLTDKNGYICNGKMMVD